MVQYTNEDRTDWGSVLVDTTEPIFTTFFTLECIMKCISMGFILEKGCYLRDPWNWLDFIVVTTALLTILPWMQNISGLRTFRLFRPLRSLSALPSMKILVGTLLNSIIQLGNIMALAMFFFGIFAILGISLWSGVFYQRCRLTETPVNGDWPVVPDDEQLCGGFRECEYACGSLY